MVARNARDWPNGVICFSLFLCDELYNVCVYYSVVDAVECVVGERAVEGHGVADSALEAAPTMRNTGINRRLD